MAACQQALLQINSPAFSTATQPNRFRGGVVAVFGSRAVHGLRATRFTGLRRELPLKLSTRERLQQRVQCLQCGDGGHGRRGLGLKPVLAGLSGVPEGNLGLYDPSFDKDSCGVGFVAELSAKPNRKIVSGASTQLLFAGFMIQQWSICMSLKTTSTQL